MITLKTLIINAPVELRDTLEKINGRITLIRHLAAWHQPTQINSPTTSAKMVLRSIARRWLALHKKVDGHDRELERMAREKAPRLMASHGISTMTVAQMLILVGDNPERIGSEAARQTVCD